MPIPRRVAGRVLLVTVIYLASLSGAAAPQAFSGVIADSECETGDHRRMRMGKTDAECAKACVEAHGASYVLHDGARTFALTDQKLAQQFAGQEVTVEGTLDASGKTIKVDSITSAR